LSILTVSRRFEVKEVRGILVVRLLARRLMDAEPIRALGHDLRRLLRRQQRPCLLLDLGAVEYLSSLAVVMLYQTHEKVTEAGGQLALCGLNRELAQVLNLAELDEEVQVFRDEGHALHHL
jgi:anti-anti-sigma factor